MTSEIFPAELKLVCLNTGAVAGCRNNESLEICLEKKNCLLEYKLV
jgi:hypothetical protein